MCWSAILICLLSLPTPDDALKNVVTLREGVILNGSAPRTPADFAALKAHGVRTIVAVDGAAPQVQLARQHGMRYVHLPISYDTVPLDRQRSFARIVHNLPKPVYFHCLHGQHRSPAAAAATMVRLGYWEPDKAIALLNKVGTSKHYDGLFEAVRTASPFDAAELQVTEEWRAVAETSDLIRQMLRLDETMARLEILADNEWRTPAEHPDLNLEHLLNQMERQVRAVPRMFPPPAHDPPLPRCSEVEPASTCLDGVSLMRIDDINVRQQGWQVLQRGCRECHARKRD